MKLSISHKNITADKEAGILYVLVIELEDTTLIKVGVTCRDRVEDRVCEVLTAIWKRYRIFPQCVVKRYTRVKDVYGLEKKLHRKLAADRYKTKHRFSGSTEFFSTHIDTVVKIYDEITNRPC